MRRRFGPGPRHCRVPLSRRGQTLAAAVPARLEGALPLLTLHVFQISEEIPGDLERGRDLLRDVQKFAA